MPGLSDVTLWIKEQVKDVAIAAMSADIAQSVALRLETLPRFEAWCAANACPIVETRSEMHARVMAEIGTEKPINYLEFGVFQGESFRWWLAGCPHPDSRFVGFDTFRGLPEDWKSDRLQGHFDVEGRPPEVNDQRASFRVGLFQDTLPGFLKSFQNEQRTVIHLDADLFSATLFTLVHLLPLLRAGDVLIFDEFHDYTDEYRAFEYALKACPRTVRSIVGMAGALNRGYARVALSLA